MVNFATARLNMVESQVRTNKVSNQRLLDALGAIPREDYVPEALREIAYVDEDLAISPDRFLMEPMVLARLLQAAAPGEQDMALDIACGTGYSTAILSRLCATVVALEEDAQLIERSNKTLNDAGIDNAVVVRGDLTSGYAKQGPYDVIFLGGAVETIPTAITDQLNDGGRLVTVIVGEDGIGRAALVQRQGAFLSERKLFDAAVPRLKSFDRVAEFVF